MKYFLISQTLVHVVFWIGTLSELYIERTGRNPPRLLTKLFAVYLFSSVIFIIWGLLFLI